MGIPNSDSITGGGAGLDAGADGACGLMKWQQIAMTAIWPASCMHRPKKGLDMAEGKRPVGGLQPGEGCMPGVSAKVTQITGEGHGQECQLGDAMTSRGVGGVSGKVRSQTSAHTSVSRALLIRMLPLEQGQCMASIWR
jgi:hypothetical protein